MFEQRQRSRFAGNVAQDCVHKTRLKGESHTAGRLFDGLSQHVRVHWTNEELLPGDTRRQIGPGCAFRQEIGPHCQQHCRLAVGNRRRIQQIAEKWSALFFVAAKRKDFLELIDHPDDSPGWFVR